MPLNAFTSNQGTQTPILTDNTGGVNGTVIAVQKVDISGQGTAGTLWNGGVTGTINAGSISVIAGTIGTIATLGTLPNLPQGSINVTAGTIATLGTMGTLGQLNTIGTLPNIPGGTINILAGGTLGILTNGTLSSVGTATGVGSISNLGSMAMLTAGTISMLSAGTLTVIPNIPGGTINILAGGTLGILTNGTLSSSGTTTGVGSVSNIGSMAMLTAGTVSMLNAGTITIGTFQINPLTATNLISHAGTSGTIGIGTLVGTASIGAGTALYITNFRIVAISGTPEVILAFGSVTNGNQIVHHGAFPPGGGIANPVSYPHGYGTTNSPLTYQILSGAGTVSWDVDYFTHT